MDKSFISILCLTFTIAVSSARNPFTCSWKKKAFRRTRVQRTQNQENTLECTCHHDTIEHLDLNESIIQEILKKQSSNQKINALDFKYCKFDTIEGNVFKNLNLSHLKKVSFVEKCTFGSIGL